MLTHCIEHVFEILPPDDSDIPSVSKCTDAATYIQAFLFNVFGALDNLAWIWVQEKGITNKDGNQLREDRVGLGQKHKEIRRTFSDEFRKYLSDHSDWFKHLADFRHALAHRIPLYIPRYVIPKHNQPSYDQLQKDMDALRDNVMEYERLTFEQMKLVLFQPEMMHSIFEKSPRVVFHPQILNDFAIVEEIGRKLLIELCRDIPGIKLSGPGRLARLFKCLRLALFNS